MATPAIEYSATYLIILLDARSSLSAIVWVTGQKQFWLAICFDTVRFKFNSMLLACCLVWRCLTRPFLLDKEDGQPGMGQN